MNKMRISKVIKKYPNGKTQQLEYRVNGLLHNPTYMVNNEDDYLRVPKLNTDQVVPNNNKIVYALTTYYESGSIESVTDYYQNKKHGVSKWFYKLGGVQCETYWFNNGLHREPLNGKPQPAVIEWFGSGALRSKSYWIKDMYAPGIQVGNKSPFFVEYDIKGNIIKMSGYDIEGKIVILK